MGDIRQDNEKITDRKERCDFSRDRFSGKAAAVIHRIDDSEDKLVVLPDGITMQPDEILSAVSFAERYFDPVLYLLS